VARTSIDIPTSVDQAWAGLQLLPTWEGVAGIEDLRAPELDPVGNLLAFRFAMNTAVGRVNGRANVRSNKPGMTVLAEQKGIAITVQVVLLGNGDSTMARVEARAKATSFMSTALVIPLNALLENSIESEAAKIGQRMVGSS
jgi:hypothetical protein